jgi:2-dehydro-3-deoxy-D-arabinonate dehydratase
MHLYRTTTGPILLHQNQAHPIPQPWDDLIQNPNLQAFCEDHLKTPTTTLDPQTILPPIESQEVWAAGVTYYRSRSARIEESASAGSFYDLVYTAPRPELFFKSTPRRVIGPRGKVRIRSDAHWSVPEPELTLLISPTGAILGYTIGNDMSSRDIEGENPLYLPQAKIYDGSCALGPCIWLTQEPIPRETEIELTITRANAVAFHAKVALTELKRDLPTLVEYLYRDNSHPAGCFLMTGTGIVPPDTFTLHAGDRIDITIPPIGTLTNTVA